MKTILNPFAILIIAMIIMVGCEPQVDDKITLPPPPSAAEFIIEELPEDNSYQFVSTIEDGFLYSWDLGNGTTVSGPEAMAVYASAGVYIVELTVFNAGGHVTSTQSVIVENDLVVVEGPCDEGTLKEFVSNCDQKTWRLNPAAGALLVGPVGLAETWWQNDESVVDERFCAFDDEWTFYEDGTMVYDTKGDIWGEDYMGFDFLCVDEAMLPDPISAWGSGTHTYTAIGTDLSVGGLGAFIGLPKATNGGEVNAPVDGITYSVVSQSTNADGDDIMVIQINYVAGVWQFTLVAI